MEGRLRTILRPWSAAMLTAVLAIGSVGLGGSAESPDDPKADIQQGNYFCGADLSTLPVIGFAKYQRSGETVSVKFRLKSARPDHTYYISLWTRCSPLSALPGVAVTTNKKGVANVNLSVDVPLAITLVHATAYSSSTFYDNTPAVTLEP
jgi:hypothetical protein